MPVTITSLGIIAVVGASADTWGALDNAEAARNKGDLDALATLANATETAAASASTAASTAQTTANNAAPSGLIAPFFRASAPTGWLLCEGQDVSRSTYSFLWVAMGSPNTGNGSSTFTLPDLRGEFIRGMDRGRAVDPDRVLGSFQAQDIQAHSHAIPAFSNTDSGTNVEDAGSSGFAQSAVTGTSGGAETRPRNVALTYCIKT